MNNTVTYERIRIAIICLLLAIITGVIPADIWLWNLVTLRTQHHITHPFHFNAGNPKMAVNGFALASMSAGALFMYAGIKGISITGAVQDIVQGKNPKHAVASNQFNVTKPSASPTASSGGSIPANPSAYQQYAFSLFGQYGWGTDQEAPLISLWNQESTWKPDAENPSGAYGIPQALPASKMASAGSDWRTNPQTQIRWGLGYIKSIYGNPANAWAHEQANNWY